MSMLVAGITGFLNERVKMGDEERQAQADLKTAEAERKKDAMKLVAKLVSTKDLMTPAFIESGYFQKNLTAAGFKTEDVTGFATKMADVDASFNYGSVKFQKPNKKWDEDTRGDNQLRAGDTWLRYFNNVFADKQKREELLSELDKNPLAKQKWIGQLTKFSNYYVDGQLQKKMETGSGDTKFRSPDIMFPVLFNNLPSKPAINVDEKVKNAAAERGEIKDPSTALVFTFTAPDGEQRKEPFDYTTTELNSITAMATRAGFSDVQEYIKEFPDKIRAETAEEAYDILLTSADYHSKGYQQLNLTGGGSEAMRVSLGNDLKEDFGGDPYLEAQSLLPLVTIREDKKNESARRKAKANTSQFVVDNTYEVQLAPPEDYFERNKLNRSKIMDQYEASNTALAQLKKLRGFLTDDMTPTGLKAAIQKAGFGIAGESGQIDQFFGNLEEGTTSQNLIQGAIDKGFLSKDVATNLSTIDSLKLSLAAQMARAVDPSGRLSNQDFEIQLQRLGATGLFTSKIQAGASLDQVIEDFQRTQRRLVLLNEVATEPNFGIREARLLKADRIARSALNAAYRAGSTSVSQASSTDAPAPRTDLTLDSDIGLYTDGESYFKDAAGTQQVSDEEVMKAMGAT